MAGGDPKAARAGEPAPEAPDAAGRARRSDADQRAGEQARRDEAEVELALTDLIADANGEVAFFNDSGFRTIGITADAAVVAEGTSGRHVTAGGTDVAGYRYLRFDNGVTLFVESGMEVIVRGPVRGA